ncbi:heat stress transcription factor A-2-like [Coffea eugenioides]|uniref:heat stress transcription factor A-2-like n=1 Tax=Coffea eugenioides TaxID=49369 RepID=UPI000F612454|nr:heat stress transcription factor A-2-like [Coffea eugenioides]
MEATNQETSEVTNSTKYELKNGENEEERVNPTIPMGTDVSESSSNAIVTAAAAVFATPLAKEGRANGASSSSSRVRAPPPFLLKVYDIVKNPETDSIISWSSSGTSFIVWDPHRFAAEGFRKINWDRLEFQNAWFQKGKKSWLKNIKRRIQGTQNAHLCKPLETEGQLSLSGKQKKFESLMQEHDALKVEMMKLKDMEENLVKEIEILEKQAQCITSKRQNMLKYTIHELLIRKKKLQNNDVANEQGSGGRQSIESSVELLVEGGTSHGSRKNSPRAQSGTGKTFSNVDLSTAVQEEEDCTVSMGTFSNFYTTVYSSLEKQLMDDISCENVLEEERANLRQNEVIHLEDLIEGPADWNEFAKGIGTSSWCFTGLP